MKNKTANQKFTCDSTSLIDMQAVLDSHHKNAWIHFHSLFCESSFDAVIIVVFINGDKFTECWRTTIDRSIDRLNDVGMMMKCQWGVDQIHGDGWMAAEWLLLRWLLIYYLWIKGNGGQRVWQKGRDCVERIMSNYHLRPPLTPSYERTLETMIIPGKCFAAAAAGAVERARSWKEEEGR